MSGDLRITFAHDMPPMAVDVVAPDFDVVKRLMMSANRTEVVSVPSENSFLRVHLPSGRTVSLSDPGNLDRTVSLKELWFTNSAQRSVDPPEAGTSGDVDAEEDGAGVTSTERASVHTDVSANVAWQSIERQSPPRDLEDRRELRQHHIRRAWIPPDRDYEDQEVPLGSNGRAWIEDGQGLRVTAGGTTHTREASWTVSGWPLDAPYTLHLAVEGRELSLRVPANTQRVWARADRLTRERRLTYSIRLESSQPAADATLNYLRRGDFGAARTMEEWAENSQNLLYTKMEDPYAAAVGGYLLLKLQRFDLMRDWARNLADRFPFLPDGCVIWASQMIHQEPSKEADIKKYILAAVGRGLPVYTDGLRLLIEGLRLLGQAGEAHHQQLRAQLGEVVWSSPVTATVVSRSGISQASGSGEPIMFDIEFGAKA